MTSRALPSAALALVPVLLLTGCSSPARDKLLANLAYSHLFVADYVQALAGSDPVPQRLADLTDDPGRLFFVWDSTGSPDDLSDLGPERMVAYEYAYESGVVSLSARLLGYGNAGGGWFAETAYGYLCVEYTIADGGESAESSQVDCPEGLVPRSDEVTLVNLGDVLQASNSGIAR